MRVISPLPHCCGTNWIKKKKKTEQSTYFLKETGKILKIQSSSLSDGPKRAEARNELKWKIVMCIISTLKYEYLIMFLLCHPKLFLWDFDCSWRKWIYSFIILNSYKSYSLIILQLSVIFFCLKKQFLRKSSLKIKAYLYWLTSHLPIFKNIILNLFNLPNSLVN